jgi:hypothetical protein
MKSRRSWSTPIGRILIRLRELPGMLSARLIIRTILVCQAPDFSVRDESDLAVATIEVDEAGAVTTPYGGKRQTPDSLTEV